MIEAGTLLGGRYLIEGERQGDDVEPSWMALDRQLHRRVVVVVLAGGTAAVSRGAYAGRLLDGGQHEGEAYLILRGGDGAEPGDPTVVTPRPDPLPHRKAQTDAPAPVVHTDATDAMARPVADGTAVQPLPVLTAAPAPEAPRGPGLALSAPALARLAALSGMAFVLGAGVVVALAVLASPEPAPPDPAAVAAGEQGDARPARTLPAAPGTSAPLVVPPPSESTTSTTAAPATSWSPPPPVTVPETEPPRTQPEADAGAELPLTSWWRRRNNPFASRFVP